ncbi:DinB family protein [Planctobacterium marinum]|uniref:DinB-like domain-containing protein n=1 Tax=Planctobacterium marinum TaxID=1631968 RepID=A0AA48HDF2_9ALTE|nr:hypothetical protein MACH26_04790 [Planctobacterium marinum]
MIASQLEIIAQGKQYLLKLTDAQYVKIVKPLFNSSAGAHMRHIIDHYMAVMDANEAVVNYNVRHRFCDAEKHRGKALEQLTEIETWLAELSEEQLNHPVSVISEISISSQQDFAGNSTLGRELVFVSSHAVHHYFTLKLIAKSQGIQLDESFGLAPATASFQRGELTG